MISKFDFWTKPWVWCRFENGNFASAGTYFGEVVCSYDPLIRSWEAESKFRKRSTKVPTNYDDSRLH